MPDRPPVIDLSSGDYDALERKIAEYLNIKVLLIRDWETSMSQQFNQGGIIISVGDDGTKQAQDALRSSAETTHERLAANLRARDPELGQSLTDQELRSLTTVGHVTIRRSNAEAEKAVIIFDPANEVKSIHDFIGRLFGRAGIPNAWHDLHKDRNEETNPRYLPVAEFIENFDFNLEDWRTYAALMDTRYALKNQHEYDALDRGWYYDPFYYRFAGITSDGAVGKMHKPARELYSLSEAYDLFEAETFLSGERKELFQDPDFLDKLLLAGAIGDLSISGAPFATLGRLFVKRSGSVDISNEDLRGLGEKLEKRLDEILHAHIADSRPEYDLGSLHISVGPNKHLEFPLRDFRILCPLFRELYEKDDSKDGERLYLDTIMKALQKYFPTLTNGPVPDLLQEPPRTLAGYRNNSGPDNAPPQSPPAPSP